MAPLYRVAVAVFALLALQSGGTALAAAPPDAPAVSADSATAVSSWSTNTTIWIELQPDGDARWTISMIVSLEDERSVTAFRDVGNRFEAGEANVLSADTFRKFVDIASRATGREMRLLNVSRQATVQGQTGRLQLSFTWTHFGRRNGTKLHVGDAFDAPGGTWLPGLAADQRLVIEGPSSFAITDAPHRITIENGTIRWRGPQQFDPSYLSITYSTDAVTTTVTRTTPSNVTPTPSDTDTATPETGGSIPVVGAGIVLVLVVAAGLFLLRGADLDDADDQDGTSDGGEDGGTAPSEGESTPDDEESEIEPSEPSPSVAGEEPAESDVTSSDATDETEADEEIDRELLSDEEYVEALIERNGGRMKQADIVTETGWSNAKVSQLLSGMAEDGRVEKLRIGRENLISFPDDDADDDDLPR